MLRHGFVYEQLPEGTTLLRVGEISTFVWIVLSGVMEFLPATKTHQRVTQDTELQTRLLGFEGCLYKQPSPFDIRLTTPSQVLKLGVEHFWTMLANDPGIRRELLKSQSFWSKPASSDTANDQLISLGERASELMLEVDQLASALNAWVGGLRSDLTVHIQLERRLNEVRMAPEERSYVMGIIDRFFSVDLPCPPVRLDETQLKSVPDRFAESVAELKSMGMRTEDFAWLFTAFDEEVLGDLMRFITVVGRTLNATTGIATASGKITSLVTAVKVHIYRVQNSAG